MYTSFVTPSEASFESFPLPFVAAGLVFGAAWSEKQQEKQSTLTTRVATGTLNLRTGWYRRVRPLDIMCHRRRGSVPPIASGAADGDDGPKSGGAYLVLSAQFRHPRSSGGADGSPPTHTVFLGERLSCIQYIYLYIYIYTHTHTGCTDRYGCQVGVRRSDWPADGSLGQRLRVWLAGDRVTCHIVDGHNRPRFQYLVRLRNVVLRVHFLYTITCLEFCFFNRQRVTKWS